MRATALLAQVCLVVSLSAGPPQTSGAMLPPVALQAADAGVAPLAFVLARAGITAGIVTTRNPSDFTFLRAASGLDATPTLPVADAVARLIQSHPEYRATWREARLSLAPDGAACTSGVRSTMVGPMEYEGDATRVVVFLTWLVRGRAGQPRGTTGSVLGSPKGAGVDPSMAALKSMPALNYVLTEPVPMSTALDKVVEMTRGGVWFAWQHTRSDGRTGCRAVVYFPNGLVSAPDEDFFVTPTPARTSPAHTISR